MPSTDCLCSRRFLRIAKQGSYRGEALNRLQDILSIWWWRDNHSSAKFFVWRIVVGCGRQGKGECLWVFFTLFRFSTMRTLNRYLDCTVPVFSCFLAGLHLSHAHIQVPVPLLLVATLLAWSDGSSISEGPQSNNDLSQINNIALSNVTPPLSTVKRNWARTRSRGTSHRQRYSLSHIAHSSLYETI